jgi:NADH-quinone oxidoreductase subunit G
MPRIIIDGKTIDCRDGVPVLMAALEAGWDVPHYCYHPALSVVASCRLCLMEMKAPDPKTKELVWGPRLVPSCQTPVRDGMEVRFDSDAVRSNQAHCMEYYLLNHPLDCPVCDQSGECYLQDYSLHFGAATSRMVEHKTVNPKKDVGSRTLLYQDRCVMCSRCVRFCDEVAGTSELCVVNRGHLSEIDVFPGRPLENGLQGNVVDICPVGALLDKDFLMKQRVWYLQGTESVCPGCSTGCTIRIDHNDGRIWRLKPRYNPQVNEWWICDEGRFGWKHVHDRTRLARPIVRRGRDAEWPEWSEMPRIVRLRFEQAAAQHGAEKVAAVLSPFMSCEEAWLLAQFIRKVAPQATLAMGPVPVSGEDQNFPQGNGEPVKFTIRAEKCPNRRGVEKIIENAGGATAAFDEFIERGKKGAYAACWIVGGAPREWAPKELLDAAGRLSLLVVQDIFPSDLSEQAAIVLPACAWAEREGSFINHAGLLQPFSAALPPPEGAQRDGQYLYAIAGHEGLYRAAKVRALMAEQMPEFAHPHVPPPPPEHLH